jgi:simple sugar transport system ATP-binding protein
MACPDVISASKASRQTYPGAVSAPAVEMRGIGKRFPGVIANEDVNLDLRSGEVHALLGENGAGKTTLMRILSGLYQADRGTISIDGKPCSLRSPSQALEAGIGMVHQNFRLVETLTVAENIHLGWNSTPVIISPAILAKRTREVFAAYRLQVEPEAKVRELSVGEQQRVEILRVLARGVRILILDEPTSVLTPHEAEELFRVIRSLVSNGQTVVFISHKLDEVLAIADRVTVLRNGKKVDTCSRADCTHRSLSTMMVGRDVGHQVQPKAEGSCGNVVLKVQGLNALSDRNLPALIDVNLEIRAREILGVAGVAGNGQKELAEVLTGLRLMQSGKVELSGEDVTGWTPEAAVKAGVGHIPESRLGMGLIADASVMENAILREYDKPPISRGPWLIVSEAERFARTLLEQAGVRVPTVNTWLRLLSGGNQQRLLARREIMEATRLLVAVHPTRGLDLVATAELRQSLSEYRNQGGAILLISEDLDEILLMSDRVAVMYRGKIIGESLTPSRDRERIGLLMGGASEVHP